MDQSESGPPLLPQERKPEGTSNAQSLLWRLIRSSGAIGAATALVTMLGAITATFINFRDRTAAETRVMEVERERVMAQRMAIEAHRATAEAERLLQENAALRKTLDTVRHNGKESHFAELSPADRQQLQQVKTDEDSLRSRLSALETTLMATPEKAIAVPMLKQQIDTVQDRSRADLDGVRGELGRLFTLTQWFIGLMFTIALGVFGLALTNLRKANDRQNSEKERPATAYR